MSMQLTILGCGNMGRAILSGVLRAGLVPAQQVRITSLNAADAQSMADELGVQVAASNTEAVQQADVIILGVKPQQYADLAAEIRPQLKPGVLLVSIAAGMTMERLETMYGSEARLFHVMPNTPALIGQGMTAIAPNAPVTP
ncbi:MAG: prephenate dehydrogenase/arogenate dehydrogenase family protein, partial [Ramlibacter sp.]|nr:prephenate dehydrogenase/arogenate dehydrogenase family protein [Ramlibacter sp.]